MKRSNRPAAPLPPPRVPKTNVRKGSTSKNSLPGIHTMPVCPSPPHKAKERENKNKFSPYSPMTNSSMTSSPMTTSPMTASPMTKSKDNKTQNNKLGNGMSAIKLPMLQLSESKSEENDIFLRDYNQKKHQSISIPDSCFDIKGVITWIPTSYIDSILSQANNDQKNNKHKNKNSSSNNNPNNNNNKNKKGYESGWIHNKTGMFEFTVNDIVDISDVGLFRYQPVIFDIFDIYSKKATNIRLLKFVHSYDLKSCLIDDADLISFAMRDCYHFLPNSRIQFDNNRKTNNEKNAKNKNKNKKEKNKNDNSVNNNNNNNNKHAIDNNGNNEPRGIQRFLSKNKNQNDKGNGSKFFDASMPIVQGFNHEKSQYFMKNCLFFDCDNYNNPLHNIFWVPPDNNSSNSNNSNEKNNNNNNLSVNNINNNHNNSNNNDRQDWINNIIFECLKGLCGFLNSEGGTFYGGITADETLAKQYHLHSDNTKNFVFSNKNDKKNKKSKKRSNEFKKYIIGLQLSNDEMWSILRGIETGIESFQIDNYWSMRHQIGKIEIKARNNHLRGTFDDTNYASNDANNENESDSENDNENKNNSNNNHHNHNINNNINNNMNDDNNGDLFDKMDLDSKQRKRGQPSTFVISFIPILRGNGEIIPNLYVLKASIKPPVFNNISDIVSMSSFNVASKIEFVCNDGKIYRKEMYCIITKTPDTVYYSKNSFNTLKSLQSLQSLESLRVDKLSN